MPLLADTQGSEDEDSNEVGDHSEQAARSTAKAQEAKSNRHNGEGLMEKPPKCPSPDLRNMCSTLFMVIRSAVCLIWNQWLHYNMLWSEQQQIFVGISECVWLVAKRGLTRSIPRAARIRAVCSRGSG